MPSPGLRRWFAAITLILAVTIVPLRAEHKEPAAQPGGDFMRRLIREADRYGRHDSGSPAPASGDDTAQSDQRSRQAERIVTRAVRGLVRDQIEDLARSSAGFSQFLRRLNLSSGPRLSQIEGSPAPSSHGASRRANEAREPASASFGLRLDAHPRIVVRGRIGTLSGALEMPILERELRLSVEQDLGAHGRAVVRGGRSDERGDWATVGFSLQF